MLWCYGRVNSGVWCYGRVNSGVMEGLNTISATYLMLHVHLREREREREGEGEGEGERVLCVQPQVPTILIVLY